MKKIKNWVCQTDTTHIFNMSTQDGFCPKCPHLEGILVEQEFDAELTTEPENERLNMEKTDRQKIKKWVCNIDATHIFNEPSPDYFCPECPSFTGILVVKEFDEN